MKYEDLKSASEEELIEAHDAKDRYTTYGTAYYLDELRHREQMAVLKEMARHLEIIAMHSLYQWERQAHGSEPREEPLKSYLADDRNKVFRR